MPTEPHTRIWVLLGARRGDNNQLLALADALGLPYEVKRLEYNGLRKLKPRLLGTTLRSVTRESRARLEGPPPDVTLSIGHRSVPVVRWLKKQSGGRLRAIHLGNPRLSPTHFDLVLTTPQYPVRDLPNVVRLPVALGLTNQPVNPSEEATSFLASLPAPRNLLLIGGPTRWWTMKAGDIAVAIRTLCRRIAREGGSLIVLASPRTPSEAMTAAESAIAGISVPAVIAPLAGPPSYAELLAAAGRIFVTADSVSMISEALRTGKPVGLVPIRKTVAGTLWFGLMDWLRPGHPRYPRDLRRFWATLESQGVAGTLDAPTGGKLPDVEAIAAEQVRRLLALPARLATDGRDNARPDPANPT